MAGQEGTTQSSAHGSLSNSTSNPPSTSHPKSTDNAVEMSDLEASGVPKRTAGTESQSNLLNDVAIPSSSPIDTSFPASSTTTSPEKASTMASNTQSKATTAANTPSATAPDSSLSHTTPPTTTDPSPQNLSRLDSVAIGPSSETMPPAPATTTSEAGPVLVITLLLTSGARHPYKIDEKYLTKRNVNVPGMTESGKKDPFSISVYTLKELILREWREEWEAQPSSPSSIRLIYFGRLLDDKTALKECRFNAESANVVHMTVRPQDIVDEEDASKGKGLGRDRGDGESTAGCRCVIQ